MVVRRTGAAGGYVSLPVPDVRTAVEQQERIEQLEQALTDLAQAPAAEVPPAAQPAVLGQLAARLAAAEAELARVARVVDALPPGLSKKP